MQYTTILLDLDHTLLDSDTSEAIAFAQTLSAVDVVDPDSLVPVYQRINLELWAAVERGEITPQHVRVRRFERLVAEAGIDADPLHMADMFVAALGNNGDLYQDAREVLEYLSKRASLAMVTNGLSEVQRARIKRLDMGRYFDAIVISAEVGTAKPGTDIFDITFDQLGNPPKSSAVMVGDNLSSDIQGGTNFGIATCWYNPHSKAATATDQVTSEITSLKELQSLV
jgi:2-haloacid dehalogenase